MQDFISQWKIVTRWGKNLMEAKEIYKLLGVQRVKHGVYYIGTETFLKSLYRRKEGNFRVYFVLGIHWTILLWVPGDGLSVTISGVFGCLLIWALTWCHVLGLNAWVVTCVCLCVAGVCIWYPSFIILCLNVLFFMLFSLKCKYIVGKLTHTTVSAYFFMVKHANHFSIN